MRNYRFELNKEMINSSKRPMKNVYCLCMLHYKGRNLQSDWSYDDDFEGLRFYI